jgi:hypothetical protein
MSRNFEYTHHPAAKNLKPPFAQLPRELAAKMLPWQLELYQRVKIEAAFEVARTLHRRRLWFTSPN